jgi:hypothetical protein
LRHGKVEPTQRALTIVGLTAAATECDFRFAVEFVHADRDLRIAVVH